MPTHPDLLNPSLPDTDELNVSISRARLPGMSLRDGEYEWPESGPSSEPMEGKGKKRKVGPFGAKVAAAMTGAMTTSLLMTPFDVLKTRLQTVQPSPRSASLSSIIPKTLPQECCQTSIPTTSTSAITSRLPTSNPLTCVTSSPTLTITPKTSSTGYMASQPVEPPSGCAYPSKWAGIWGESVTMEQAISRSFVGGGGGGATLVMPAEEAGLGGFFHEIATIRRETGLRGLWKGVGTTLTMSIPSAAIYMLGYEHLLSVISPHFTNSTDPHANTSSLNLKPANSPAASLTPAPLIAGSLARTFSASIISPIEMFRTRLQALPSAGKGAPTYASTSAELVHLVKEKGVTILWRGLGPTLWRDVPFSGLYWAGFEILKTSFAKNQPTLSPLTTSFLSGALSGTFAALLTQPFDVLKTRRQVFTPSPGCTTGARAATLPLALHVVRTEGWNALFAGLVPRCGKIAPACGLMIACYEGVGRYLGGSEEE